MKLIFLNRYFYPDHSATSLLLSDLAFALADRGHRIAIITSRQLYEAEKQRLRAHERIGGVDVHRVWTSRLGRHNLLGRSVDYLTFYVSAAWMLWRLARPDDIVIAKTDPPALSVVAVPTARLRGAKVINWLQDIFPETAEALGLGKSRPARLGLRLLKALRDHSLRASRFNIVLGQRMAKRVASLGVPENRIRVIANWADGARIEPRDPSANALRAEWGLTNKFVVGYSGNLGRAHDYGTILDAIERTELRKEGGETPLDAHDAPAVDIAWVFIGGGALYKEARAEASKRRLKSLQFRPYQPIDRLAESLSVPDVHLVSLLPQLEGLIVPSKFYGVAAAGRPTIFVGDRDGEIARLIARHECGRSVAVGDAAGLAQAIRELAADPIVCRRMGERARQAFLAEFDKPIAIARWEQLLREAFATRRAANQNELA